MNKPTNSILILLVGSGWAISWAIGWAIGWPIVAYIGMGLSFTDGGPIGGFISGLITGSIGGLLTALILRWTKLAFHWYHILLMSSIWAILFAFDWSKGFVIASPVGEQINYGIGGPLSGFGGGILVSVILRWVNPSVNRKHMLIIFLGWFIGFVVGGFISWSVGMDSALDTAFGSLYGESPGISTAIVRMSSGALGGGIGGLIGASATFWQLNRVAER